MTAKEIKTLKEQRGALIQKQEELIKKAEKENRGLTESEEREFEGFTKQVDSLGDIISNSENDILERADNATRTSQADGSYTFTRKKQDGTFRSIQVISSKGKASRDNSEMTFGKYARALQLGPQSEAEERALNSGDGNNTSNTIETVLSANMIDRLRAQMVTNRAGIQTVLLDSNNLKMAKLNAGVTFTWRNESELISASDPSFTSVDWSVKNLAAMVRVSNETLADSVNIEQALDNELTRGAATYIDSAILTGADAKGFTGITGMTGIQTIDQGTDGSAISNYTEILDAYQLLYAANHGDPSAAIMAPREWRTYAGLTATDNQPLMKPQAIQDLPMYQTTAMPVDLTKGASSVASKMIIGDFSQLYLGLRQDVQIRVLPERFAEYNETAFLLTFRADVQAYHENAFVIVDGVVPA